MRWPFSLLFRGDRDTSAAADAVVAGPAAPEPAGPAKAAGMPSRPAAWRSLPPLQRSVGDAPLTAPAVPFGRALAGRQLPEPILRPLAHDLAADGPAGLVSGLATPLAGRVEPATAPVTRPALPAPRGVQRRARTVVGGPPPVGEAGGSAAVVSRAATEAAPAAIASAAPVATEPSTAGAAAGLPAPPSPRVLPIVAPSAAVPALAATSVGASTAPEVARAVAPTAGPAAPDAAGSPVQRTVASPVPTVATPPAAPDGTPPAAPMASPDVVVDAAGPTPAAGAHVAQRAQPRSLGESRRLGLGAPLVGRPGVQRSVARPDLPLVRAGRSAVPPPNPAAAPPPPRRAAAAEATLPVLRLASQSAQPARPSEPAAAPAGDGATAARPAPSTAGLADPESSSGFGGPPNVPVQRSAERPLVSDAGRRPSATSDDGADAEPSAVGLGDGLPLAAGTGIDSTTGAHAAAALSAAALSPAAAAPPDGASAMPPAASGLVSADHGAAPPPSLVPAAPAALPARSVPLVVARSLRGAQPLRRAGPPPGPPRAGPPPGAALGTGHPAGAAAAPDGPEAPIPGRWSSAGPVAQRSSGEDVGSPPEPAARAGRAPLPVVRAGAGLGPSGPAAGRASGPVAVSRLADGVGSAPQPLAGGHGWSAGNGFTALLAPGSPMVQRAVEIDEMTTQVDATPAPGAAESGSGGAVAAGGGQDAEELADRVYDRIRSRFATELLLDRERMGLLIDG